MDILTLGDGNLSFSLSFAKRLLTRLPELKWTLLATTFDSRDKLIEKYPEAQHIIDEFSSSKLRQHTSLVNSVDAIRLIEHFPDTLFHEIIFNFPHLGFEDLHRHQAFLCHLFVSCTHVLHSGGYLHIALAESQEFGWRLKEAAIKQGFALTDKILVDESQWPGYDFRRHQTGKSFRQRVGNCFHYSFKLINQTSVDDLSPRNIFRFLADNPITTKPDNISSDLDYVTRQEKHQKTKAKKRKMHQLVEGKFRVVQDQSGEIQSRVNYECITCLKQYPSEQGVRTHVYTIHVLPELQRTSEQVPVEGESLKSEVNVGMVENASLPRLSSHSNPSQIALEPASKRKQLCDMVMSLENPAILSDASHNSSTIVSSRLMSWYCIDCNRDFSNQEALAQHRLAKHISIESVRTSSLEQNSLRQTDHAPTNFSASISSAAAGESIELGLCDICGWSFTSEDDRHEHQTMFAPRDLQFDVQCDLCQKNFSSERSYTQHRKICLLLQSNRSDSLIQDDNEESLNNTR